MKLNEQLDKIKKLSGIKEQISNNVIVYHGTRTDIPFSEFNPKLIGSGFVSNGTKFGGFFFTSEMENAEYYTEYFVAKVQINNVKPNPLQEKHPPTVLRAALENNEIYQIDDYLDGAIFSDIIVVPKNRITDIKILEWIFVGDEEWLFKKYDDFFGGDPDEDTGEVFVNQDLIDSMLNMIDVDVNYLLNIPVFKKYYDSKD